MMRRVLPLLFLATVLTGCATKRDLRDLRTEVEALRAAQQASLQESRTQSAAILDSVTVQNARMRGDVANHLLQVERQLIVIQELTGQGQQQLNQLRQQITSREAAAQAQAEAGDPEELFTTSVAALRRGSLSTARAGFEEFVRAFPQHARVSEAQFFIGEAHAEGKDPGRALEAYAVVIDRYPTSPRAPTALYRAAAIELEQGNRDRARDLFQGLVERYPDSDEVALAQEQLQKLRRR